MSGWLDCHFISPSVDYNHPDIDAKVKGFFFSPPAIVWPFFEHPPTQLKALKVLYLTHLASVSVTQQQFMVGTSPLKSVNSHRSTRVQKKKIVKDGFLNQYFIAQCLITSLMYSQEACMMLSSAVSDLQQSTCVPCIMLGVSDASSTPKHTNIPSILNSWFWPLETELLEERWHTIWLIL